MSKSKEPQGLSIFDIGALTDTVKVGKKELTVRGVPTEDVVELMRRFPDAMNLLAGGQFGALIRIPGLLPAIIAAGSCGDDGYADDV